MTTSSALQYEATSAYVRSLFLCNHTIVFYDRGTGPALLLVHGMFGDHLDWEPVLEPLSQEYRVVAVDLPGFGASGKLEIEYTPEVFVGVLEALLTSLGIEQAVVVGNSFGGEIATFYTLAHPERVRALVLVSSAGMRRYTPDEKGAIAAKFSETNLRALTPEIHEVLFSTIFASEHAMRWRYVAKQNAKLLRADYPAYTRVLSRCAELAFGVDTVSLLRQVEQPMLLLWGDKDVVFPPGQAKAALPLLSKADLRIIPGAGHAPQLEQPEIFVSLLASWLEGK